MLTGNHYFSHVIKPDVITGYFQPFENTLDTNNNSGTHLLKCHYYSKLKGNTIYTSTYLLGLRKCAEAVDSLNIIDLVFANFTDVKSVPADSGLDTPDFLYITLFWVLISLFPHVNNNLICEFSYRNFAAGTYTLLDNILSQRRGRGICNLWAQYTLCHCTIRNNSYARCTQDTCQCGLLRQILSELF
jgi:hypothetical protein